MKKGVLLTLSAALALASCGSYAGQGAATGATFGTILGSAICGITGGPRGSDVGTLVGMAGGAALGAAVGSAADKAKQEEYRRYMEYRDSRYGGGQGRGDWHEGGSAYNPPRQQADESGFDPTHSGDDRIVMEPEGGSHPQYGNAGRPVAAPSVSVDELKATMPGYKLAVNKGIEVRNISFADAGGDGALSRRESAKVSFEVMNFGGVTLYDVHPMVVESTGNKHVHVSPPLRVESIAPGRGVRYTATVFADSRLKDGEAVLRLGVVQGDKEITSQVRELRVPLRKR